jgi:acyl-CoA reductase-like NAD-dependent aldehyde dehydrogenase
VLTIRNPATEELLQTLEEDDEPAVARKYALARAAQPEWAAQSLGDRIATVRRFGDLLAERRNELAGRLTAEMGKPVRQSRNEIDAMQGRIAFFLEHTPRALAGEDVYRSDGPPPLAERIAYEPLGVIANISAWNYPYFVGSNVFVPALLAGNSVLYKPSEHATLTGLAIADLLHEAGVPGDVFAPIIGHGGTGALLLKQHVDGVFFTGSYATGRRIAEAVSSRLIPVQLELGGKDPAYVCDDVDVPAAAAALVEGAFYNAGQSCCAVERIYVHHRIAAPFKEAFVAQARALRIGDPADERTAVGPLGRAEQLELLERQVADAVRLGARVALGGARCGGTGYFFAPTVLFDVDHRMQVMRDESFGPVIGIQEVADDAEALTLMNDTEYGLTAAVYSRDRARAERILGAANTGTVYWNCCDRVSPRLPWSGRGHSGIGVTLSIAGIRALVRPKAWHLRESSTSGQ